MEPQEDLMARLIGLFEAGVSVGPFREHPTVLN
jgi:hypothetical protein